MTRSVRLAALAAGLGLLVLLSGCPGLPGAGGGGASSQQTPPGVLPPPGLESGGVRTIVGATITPPTNNVLLVTYTTTGAALPPGEQSARRVAITENAVLIEGLNFNGRVEGQPKDVNRLLPLSQVTSLTWRYEGQPTPPPSTTPPPGGGRPGPGRRGR